MKESQTKRFCRCIKKVRKTIKARKGSSKESGAIGVCVKSVLQRKLEPTGRTLFKFHCRTRKGLKGRVVTQPQKGGKHYTIREDPCRNSPVTLTSIPKDGQEDSILIHKSARDMVILKPGDTILSIGLGPILRGKSFRRSKSRSASASASASVSHLTFEEAHYKSFHAPKINTHPTLKDYQITNLLFRQDGHRRQIDCEDFKEFAKHVSSPL
jgi:hypothetical protein